MTEELNLQQTNEGVPQGEVQQDAAPEQQPSQKQKPTKVENQGLFTQEQLNRFLAEERRKAEARAHRQIEEIKQSVTGEYEQKLAELVARFEGLEKVLKQKEEEAQRAQELAQRAQREATVASLAAKLGARPEAVPDIVKLFQADGDNLEESLNNFLKERPYYLQEQRPKPNSVSRINATNPSQQDGKNLDWHPLLRAASATSIFGGDK